MSEKDEPKKEEIEENDVEFTDEDEDELGIEEDDSSDSTEKKENDK